MNFVFSISLFKPVVWSRKAAAPEVPTPGTNSNSIGSALAPDTKTVIFSSEKVTIFYKKLTIFNEILFGILFTVYLFKLNSEFMLNTKTRLLISCFPKRCSQNRPKNGGSGSATRVS